MELDAVKGRNQRGICYVHSTTAGAKTALIRYQDAQLYADIRVSDRLDPNLVIMDSRLFDELGCTSPCKVTLEQSDEEIPECSEITLLVDSLDDIENRKVVQAVSKRIEDFKDHLDGLILGARQTVDIPALKLRIIVDDVRPKASISQVSRVVWKYLLKVNLIALMERQCCNVCFAVDIGASSSKEDVAEEGSGELRTRIEVVLDVLNRVLSQGTECEDTLAAAIAFGGSAIRVKSDEESMFSISNASSQILHDLLLGLIEQHSREPSNPGEALELALEAGIDLTSRNGLPTVVLLISGGTYSAGRNPVSIARRIAAEENIVVTSLAIGGGAELDMMQAISDAGGGRLIHIGQVRDVSLVVDSILDWNRHEAGGK